MLNDIVTRFSVTVPALMAANHLPDELSMQVGQQMVIPNPSLVLRVADAMAEQDELE